MQHYLSLPDSRFACLVIIACWLSVWSLCASAQCPPPTNLQAQAQAGTNNIILTWTPSVAGSDAWGYDIRITNLVTNQTSTQIVSSGGNTSQALIEGLMPANDYLLRIRTVCCTPTPPNALPPSCFSAYARTASSVPEGYAAVINLERTATGATTTTIEGPIRFCNLDLVKSATITVKNLTTLANTDVVIPPDSCICLGDNYIYKLTAVTPNFKIDAPHTRTEDCLAGGTKTDEADLLSMSSPLVALYPNPSSGMVQLGYGNTYHQSLQLDVWNTAGQIVASHTLPATEYWYNTTLDLSHLPNGVYFCQFSGAQDTHVQKWVLQK